MASISAREGRGFAIASKNFRYNVGRRGGKETISMGLIINGQRVNDDLLGAEFAGIKSYHERQGNVSCCERDEEFRGYAKQNIIARVLLTQEAQSTTPEPSAAE